MPVLSTMIPFIQYQASSMCQYDNYIHSILYDVTVVIGANMLRGKSKRLVEYNGYRDRVAQAA